MITKIMLGQRYFLIVSLSLLISNCTTVKTSQDWETANRIGTATAYEQFLQKHPKSKHKEQAEVVLDSLRFEKATANNSIVAYESYLQNHPAGSGSNYAENRLRELRYVKAREKMTVAAYESFISRYSFGEDVDKLKQELSIVKALEKSFALGKAIMSYAPKTYISTSVRGPLSFSAKGTGSTISRKSTQEKKLVTERHDPTTDDLFRMQVMLMEGADPKMLCVFLGLSLLVKSSGAKG